jgi:hypothetical protein
MKSTFLIGGSIGLLIATLLGLAGCVQKPQLITQDQLLETAQLVIKGEASLDDLRILAQAYFGQKAEALSITTQSSQRAIWFAQWLDYDGNRNQRLDDPEILRAIEFWINGTLYHGEVITDNDVIELIYLWIEQTPILPPGIPPVSVISLVKGAFSEGYCRAWLSGKNSYDPDGYIVRQEFVCLNGVNVFTFSDGVLCKWPGYSGLLRHKLTDNDGLITIQDWTVRCS